MDARIRPLDADNLDHAVLQRPDDTQPTSVRDLAAFGRNLRHRNDLPMHRTYAFRESRRLAGVMMPRTVLPIAWLIALAILIAGCSSSQQSTTSETKVSTDSQASTILR